MWLGQEACVDLDSIPGTSLCENMLHGGGHCNPGTEEVETGGANQPSLTGELTPMQHLPQEMHGIPEGGTRGYPLPSTSTM